MTNVYIVNHLNVFHSLILQNLTTYGWSTQATMTNVYTVNHTDTQTKHYLRYNKVFVKTGIYVKSGS